MCGTTGIDNVNGRDSIARELLGRMNDSRVHRVPDGAGYFVKDKAGLEHCRLSIGDLAGDAQRICYAVVDGRLPVTPELEPLLECRHLERKNDESAVEDYSTVGHVPNAKCMLLGMHKPTPGHMPVGKPSSERIGPIEYWDVSFDDAIEDTFATLKRAVRLRMIADLLLGSFLSGGVDASAAVAMMADSAESPDQHTD